MDKNLKSNWASQTEKGYRAKENFLTIISVILILAVILLLPSVGVLVAFVLVLLVLFLQRKKIKALASIGFKKPHSWIKTILFCAALGIGIELFFQIFFNPLFEYLTKSQIDLSAFENIRGSFINYLVMLIIGWVIGGFLEEITFRGFLISRLANIFGDKPLTLFFILLITSAPFGFSHLYQSWSGVLSTGTIAFLFGIIFIKSKCNLWYTILTHGFVNVTGITIIYLNLDGLIRNIW